MKGEVMNCSEVKELIQLYMDNELDARSALAVQRHLEMCANCTRLLDFYLEQYRILKDYALAEQIDCSPALEAILKAIRRDIPQPSNIWRSLHLWRRVAAMAIIAIAAIALILGRGSYLGGNVYAAVVADHADHCFVQSIMGAATDPESLARLVAMQGSMKVVPDLIAFGYTNPSGRTCKVKGEEFLHLVYNGAGQPPLSVFAHNRGDNSMADRSATFREGGYSISSVSKSGANILIVSSLDEKQAADIARSIAKQL